MQCELGKGKIQCRKQAVTAYKASCSCGHILEGSACEEHDQIFQGDFLRGGNVKCVWCAQDGTILKGKHNCRVDNLTTQKLNA